MSDVSVDRGDGNTAPRPLTFEECEMFYKVSQTILSTTREEAKRTGDPNTWGMVELLGDVVHKWNGITAYAYRRDDPDGVCKQKMKEEEDAKHETEVR